MSKGESKKCERCGAEFRCNPQNISDCGCSTVILLPSARQHISEHYHDCLCTDCLLEISKKISQLNK